MSSASENASNLGETLVNGLETYVILEQIGNAAYRVICKSGRLRGRQLALQKFPFRKDEASEPHPPHDLADSIHHSLHHPNIVSLFSFFTNSLAHYHVTEYCATGSLADFLAVRSPSTLTENQLRGVSKSLIDALLYLRSERVVHYDITPSNVLLTNDYRLKIANFVFATRLSDPKAKAPAISAGTPNYLAPEVLMRQPCGFAVDLWSVGCIMITCLTGHPPFQADTLQGIRAKVLEAEYMLPHDLSCELTLLVSDILQNNPENRIDLSDIYSRPFFTRNPIVQPLSEVSRQKARWAAQLKENLHPSFTAKQGKASATILGDVSNAKSVGLASMPDLGTRGLHLPIRRVLSDPVHDKLQHPKAINGPPKSVPRVQTFTTPKIPTREIVPGLDRVEEGSNDDGHAMESDEDSSEITKVQFLRKPDIKADGLFCDNLISKRDPSVPVDATRPMQFSTTPLRSQVHKSILGQITILPSRSLLVDFREGQRRRGFRGNEVFVINPRGFEILVYSAPHLSVPCCLVEPIRRYTIQNLPALYWKQYNDAGRLIDQIKQRTPKFIFYMSEAKCTLMSNDPRGEIELLFSHSDPKCAAVPTGGQPNLRVRYSRTRSIFEIATRLSRPHGDEWTKRVFKACNDPPFIPKPGWSCLDEKEQDAVKQAILFSRLCDKLEHYLDVDQEKSPPSKAEFSQNLQSDTTERPGMIESLSDLNLNPRPSKLRSRSDQHRKRTQDGSQENELTTCACDCTRVDDPMSKVVEADITSRDCNGLEYDETESAQVQTCFIPSIGWGLRHDSAVSQGGRYTLMFLDGATLEVDADEEWLKYQNPAGKVTRCDIRTCSTNSEVMERMKAFPQFISMFEDSGNRKAAFARAVDRV